MAVLDNLPARGGLLFDKGAARIRNPLAGFRKDSEHIKQMIAMVFKSESRLPTSDGKEKVYMHVRPPKLLHCGKILYAADFPHSLSM